MDDWQAGDLAICIDGSGWANYVDGVWEVVEGPQIGWQGYVERVTVAPVPPGIPLPPGTMLVMLHFAEWPDPIGEGWSAAAFCKIKPLSDEEKREALRELNEDIKTPERA